MEVVPVAIEPKQTPVEKRSPEERRKDFREVSSGYVSKETALKEANRCLLCLKKPCVSACPVGIEIPTFIKALREDDIPEAFRVIQESNSLPGVCGRVCPQEEQCASACTLRGKFEPVNIGVLERFVSDEYEKTWKPGPLKKPDFSKPSIGVIGAGPAGLTIAGDMARHGFPVTVYEALHAPGGVLRYG
ncbi:MAG: NAD(P)-binding protein, partial [Elusimicrobia bacterium]|nr:NAD(P)-binding protein [Elusimicrobiota bacterium]